MKKRDFPVKDQKTKFSQALPHGLYYKPGYVSLDDKNKILEWLRTLYPIWEYRYSKSNPPPPGGSQRRLLRPVYWLGNWQFACLDYYHPPKGIYNRSVRAEGFPEVLAKLIIDIEQKVYQIFHASEIPKGWTLNTCLINFYGNKIENGKKIDCARVGEHKDFEPGPVASISLGERAFFQFVRSSRPGTRDGVVFQQWLEDRSLQIFGGERFKNKFFHRVQRVDKKNKTIFKLNVSDFETRRINFTFRYVPQEHWVDLEALPRPLLEDVLPYVDELARHSDFFRNERGKIKIQE